MAQKGSVHIDNVRKNQESIHTLKPVNNKLLNFSVRWQGREVASEAAVAAAGRCRLSLKIWTHDLQPRPVNRRCV
jgi:hypothetical protein